tara:strand:- start:14 stop:679 length:666 start_codon:yes stop_codon:yes gene_type:complete
MNVLRWSRVRKPKIPRIGGPRPWDFKAYFLALRRFERSNKFPIKATPIKVVNKMVEFMNSTHFYGKCPKKVCKTTIECLDGIGLLEMLGTNHARYAPVTRTLNELYPEHALPVIMNRKGLRLINQTKPKPDIFDENDEIISSIDMNLLSFTFSSSEISHLKRIEIMDSFGNVGCVKLLQQKKVPTVKYSKTKIKMKADKYPKRRVDRYQKTQRRHNTRYNK